MNTLLVKYFFFSVTILFFSLRDRIYKKKFNQFLFHATKILYFYAFYIYNILHITLFLTNFIYLYLVKNFLLKIIEKFKIS